jgi:predicted transcriptional regulator with HTH domain
MSECNNANKRIITVGVRVDSNDSMVQLGAIARSNKGKIYIMRGYVKEMAGTKIPDK